MSCKLLGEANRSPVRGFGVPRGESEVRFRWDVTTKRKNCMGYLSAVSGSGDRRREVDPVEIVAGAATTWSRQGALSRNPQTTRPFPTAVAGYNWLRGGGISES